MTVATNGVGNGAAGREGGEGIDHSLPVQSSPRKVLELWLLVDGNGDYATGTSQADALEVYENVIGSLDCSNGYRYYQLNVRVSVPSPVVVSAELPDQDGEVTVW